MKHLISVSAFVLAMIASALMPTDAVAKEWQRVKGGVVAGPSEWSNPKPKPNPFKAYMRRNRPIDMNAQLAPVAERQHLTINRKATPNRHRLVPEVGPRGTFYGGVAASNSIKDYSDIYFGKIDGATGEVSTVFYSPGLINGQDYDMQGGTIANGIYYTLCEMSTFESQEFCWRRYDINTGAELTPISFGGNWGAFAYSMAYDPKTRIFHILSFNAASALGFAPAYYQVRIPNNYQTGTVIEPVWIADIALPAFATSITYCPADGNMYLFDASNSVYVLDTRTGNTTKCAQIDDSYDAFIDYYATPVAFSPLDNAFCVYYRNAATHSMSLLFIDFDTWDVYEGPEITGGGGNPFFTSISCIDEYASADAPALTEEMVFNFDKAAKDGSISFAAPLTYFNGVAMPEGTEMSVRLWIDGGKELFNGTMKAGEEKKVDATLDEGVYTFCTQAEFSKEMVGPMRKQIFAVGNDNPNPPTDVVVTGNTISWTAPGGVGSHNGYVDTDALTYDVYFDEEKVNDTPIKGESYTFAMPADLLRRVVNVVAVANGKESLPASIISVIGKSLEVPYELYPTADEAKTFTVINANNDDLYFSYFPYNEPARFTVSAGYVSSNYNDWLIMPVTSFNSKDDLYNLQFTYFSPIGGQKSQPMDIFIGKTNTVGGMDVCIYDEILETTTTPKTIDVPFAVEEPGDYYIGFHLKGKSITGGVHLYDFKVDRKGTSAVPAAPEITITPAPRGALSATVEAVLPITDMAGVGLNTDDEVTVTVEGEAETIQIKGLPGQTVKGDIKVSASGFANFKITPSNHEGQGATKTYRKYIGFDTAKEPVNVTAKVADDNLSITLSWDAPGEVGINGGYVETESVSYNFYWREGVTYHLLGNTKETHYTYTPQNPNELEYVNLGPASVTVIEGEEVENVSSTFVTEQLGKPLELPMKETFNTTGFVYGTYAWRFVTGGDCMDSNWQNVGNNTLPPEYQNPQFTEGGTMCYSENEEGAPIKAELNVPKFSTRNCDNLTFTVRFWDYPEAPTMHIYATTKDVNRLLVADIVPNRPMRAEWNDFIVPLPEELEEQDWVRVAIRVDLDGSWTQYGIIDNILVGQDVDFDLKIASVVAPVEIVAGTDAEVEVEMVNNGNESLGGTITVELQDLEGNVLDRNITTTRRIVSNQVFKKLYKFTIKQEYVDYGTINVVATVDAKSDMISINNKRTASMKVFSQTRPVVDDLKAEWNETHDAVNLTWSEPVLEIGSRDDMEAYTPFVTAEKIGRYKTLDLDGLPNAVFDGLRWEGDDKPQSWIVFNAEQMGVMDDERLKPHSGKQYLMARCQGTDEEGAQTSDWLIFPEVVGGSEISFWVNTPSVSYSEYMVLYVSNTDDKPESFVKYKPISKFGKDAWEYAHYSLPADTKYIALEYNSYDCFGIMLDDISFAPAQLDKWVVDHYSVWRRDNNDWETFKCVADNVATTNHQDPSGDINATYNVITHILLDDGNIKGCPKSNDATVYMTGVEEFEELSGVSAGKGYVEAQGFAGRQMVLYTADGKYAQIAKLTSDVERVPAEAGIYIVKIGNAYTKVIVK